MCPTSKDLEESANLVADRFGAFDAELFFVGVKLLFRFVVGALDD